MGEKRNGYNNRDEYFMGVAKLSAMRSKDPNTQVGACIVSEDNKILSMGYNGFPKGCSDDEFPWGKDDGDPYNEKYLYVTHSELNAILNYRGGSLEGSKLYVTLFPATNVPRQLSRQGSERLFMKVTSTPSRRPPAPPSGCSMLRESGIISIRPPDVKLSTACRKQGRAGTEQERDF